MPAQEASNYTNKCEMCTITTVNSRFPQVNFVDIEYFSAKLLTIPFMSKLFKGKTYKSLN